MNRPSLDILKPYISDMQEQWLKDKAKVFPCHTNRASEAGHPCIRYLVYCRTHWQQRTVPEPDRQALYTLGNDIEDIVADQWLTIRLKKFGVQAVRPKHQGWSDERTGTTGHLDIYLEEKQDDHTAAWIPGEIKGVAVGTWEEVESHDDMKKSKRSWVRKWAVQLPFYCLMDKKLYGRYIFFQKETGKLRDFPVVLEDCFDLLDQTTEKLTEVNLYVEAGEIPNRFYEPGPPSPLCEDCDFGHLCLPGSCYDQALRMMDDAQVIALLKKYDRLKIEMEPFNKIKRDAEVIRKQLTKYFEDKPHIAVGERLITGTRVEVKPQEGYSYWRWTPRKA